MEYYRGNERYINKNIIHGVPLTYLAVFDNIQPLGRVLFPCVSLLNQYFYVQLCNASKALSNRASVWCFFFGRGDEI